MTEIDLFFPYTFTLGLGPGKAVEIRAGEIFGVDAEIVPFLKRRFGASDAADAPKGTRRITLDERKLDDGAAALASPHHDPKRLKAEEKERTDALLRAAQLRDLTAREAREKGKP